MHEVHHICYMCPPGILQGFLQTVMADVPEEESLSCFLELEAEEGGWGVLVCFLYFLNFNLLALSSSSAVLTATFHNKLSTNFMHFWVNAVPLEGLVVSASLCLMDVVLDAQPMISRVMLKSERSTGSPARS